jgi:CDP-diacylglycerol---glycerol-3-phosphate 3-phosphatidyltransferase
MNRATNRFWLATSLSLFRLVGSLIFASLAFQGISPWTIASIYGVAAVSDLIDGQVARRLHADTLFGRVLDVVGDKSLTIVSLLYASARGVDIRPLAVIAVREVVMLGARLVVVDGRPLLPTSRVFGGALALALWGTTFVLIVDERNELGPVIVLAYWLWAVAMAGNLVVRVFVSRAKFTVSASEDR